MAIKHTPIPVDELSEFLAVDPASSTGLRWIQPPGWCVKEGDDAGGLALNGHFKVTFRGRKYAVSRVVYAIYYVVDPGSFNVVHIDGNRSNNTISNLKLMYQRSYQQPMPKKSDLPIGVYMRKGRTIPYKSQINVGGKYHHLGCFLTPEEAATAYQKALAELADNSFGTR